MWERSSFSRVAFRGVRDRGEKSWVREWPERRSFFIRVEDWCKLRAVRSGSVICLNFTGDRGGED